MYNTTSLSVKHFVYNYVYESKSHKILNERHQKYIWGHVNLGFKLSYGCYDIMVATVKGNGFENAVR